MFVWGGGGGAPCHCSISRAVCGKHGDRYEVQNCQLCESLKTFFEGLSPKLPHKVPALPPELDLGDLNRRR